jgi:hypothetical protein
MDWLGLFCDFLCLFVAGNRLLASGRRPGAQISLLTNFISVDGSHQAADVLADAVLAFRLLRGGGVMAFDDYLWAPVRRGSGNPLLTPKAAVDAFTTIHAQQMRIIPNLPLYQLYIQKY